MTALVNPSKAPTKLLLQQVLGALLPSFLPVSDPSAAASSLWHTPPSLVRAEPLAVWLTSSGLRATWTTSKDPVFATTTVTLRVLLPNQPEELVAKRSLSELVLTTARSEGDVALLLAESVKSCCGLLAPHLYEHDPRKGDMVTTNRPELPCNLLFDPPGQSPPAFVVTVPCTVCGKDFCFEFGPQGHALAVWGGGNLGFLHAECCAAVGVSLHL